MAEYSQKKINKVNVPPGKLLADQKWKNSKLMDIMKNNNAKIIFINDLGFVDFRPSDEVAVLFLPEADIVSGTSYKKRLVQFRHAQSSYRKVVIVQRTQLTVNKFPDIQCFATIELGLSVVPLNTLEELGKFLVQMVSSELKKKGNPFRVKPKYTSSPSESILKSILVTPGVGEKKAVAVLEKFPTLKNVSQAPEKDLKCVIGEKSGNSMYSFFHSSHV